MVLGSGGGDDCCCEMGSWRLEFLWGTRLWGGDWNLGRSSLKPFSYVLY